MPKRSVPAEQMARPRRLRPEGDLVWPWELGHRQQQYTSQFTSHFVDVFQDAAIVCEALGTIEQGACLDQLA